MAKFRFDLVPEERRTIVYYRGEWIGELETTQEESGRPCFLLDCDRGPRPRQYRGRERAAEALLAIHKVVKQLGSRKVPLRELIVQLWKNRPKASKNYRPQ